MMPWEKFRSKRGTNEREACLGSPSITQNKGLIERVRQIVMEDCQVTIQEIVQEGNKHESERSILMEGLCMWSKISPKVLAEQQNNKPNAHA